MKIMQWTIGDKADRRKLYDLITRAAFQHGVDSEADMEIGDLQVALNAAMSMLTPEQCSQLYDEVADTIESGFLALEAWDGQGVLELTYDPAPEN